MSRTVERANREIRRLERSMNRLYTFSHEVAPDRSISDRYAAQEKFLDIKEKVEDLYEWLNKDKEDNKQLNRRNR